MLIARLIAETTECETRLDALAGALAEAGIPLEAAAMPEDDADVLELHLGEGDPAAHLRPTTDRVREAIFNLLINDNPKLTANTREVTHFDMLPTMLDLIGLQVKGGRAGLGYSAIGPVRAPRAPDHVDRMAEKLLDYSATYRELWEPLPEPAAVDGPPALRVEAAGDGAGGGVRAGETSSR